ncbi:MAG: TonB-dependent receptor [Alphaproteobacteria bacterium]|nr:TonB-dependent receptor [Alphaproteobacteria bacterium]
MKHAAVLYSFAITIFYLLPVAAFAQQPFDKELEDLLSLDLAELTVTSVAKREQRLMAVPAAVTVLTGEEIRRTGVTTLPEALRFVPGLEVARAGANSWAITSRGFNNPVASKLLVLVDGRSVYTPVFSGVYWDNQFVMIEDIERVEVIRGPGASLYGANAVNGIINVITKQAANTQGNYVSAGMGTEDRFLRGRHGGQFAEDGFFRTYLRVSDHDSTRSRANGGQNYDDWWQARTGFRIDAKQDQPDKFTLQGDIFKSQAEIEQRFLSATPPLITFPQSEEISIGANVLGRWEHAISTDNSTSVQAYIDHYSREEPVVEQQVTTADIQFQHNWAFNPRNALIWGAGLRYIWQDHEGSLSGSFRDENVSRTLIDFFLQNEYAVIPNEMFLTIGSKFEHNDYTGFEVQPNIRLSWQPTADQTFWGAVSHAVRTPNEFEDQSILTVSITPGTPPTSLVFVGNTELEAERVTSFEFGYRVNPLPRISLDTAVFYSRYSDLLTVGSTTGTPFVSRNVLQVPIPFNNQSHGRTYGVEVMAKWNVSEDWQLAGSYNYLNMKLELEPGGGAFFFGEEASPEHQFALRSFWDVTDRLQWDNTVYFVDNLQSVDEYLRFDTRLGWEVSRGVDVSLVGRNLLDDAHAEFANDPQAEIERSFLGIVTLRF